MFKNAKYLLTTHDLNLMPNDNVPEYVVVGRSNVGKSTFINALTQNKKMAHSSSKPGKTRAISLFSINNDKLRLVDIPGYGFAKVSKQQKLFMAEIINEYLSKRRNIVKAILLLDCRRKINNDDKNMIFYFHKNKIPFCIIGTKIDKVNQSEKYKFIQNIKEELKIEPILYSGIKNINLDKVLEIFE